MRLSQAHIAGIGISEASNGKLNESAVSAGTKALLDAGVTYDDVDLSLAGILDDQVRTPRSCFTTFGTGGAPICEVDNHCALSTAVQCIKSRQTNCALVIGLDRSGKTQVSLVAPWHLSFGVARVRTLTS